MVSRTMRQILLAALLLAVPATAKALPPIIVSHAYQGHTASGEKHLLSFTLRIWNPTDNPLKGIVLKSAWLNLLAVEPVILDLGDLPGRGETVARVTLATDRLPAEDELRELPLFWECNAEVSGVAVESGVESHQRLEGGLP